MNKQRNDDTERQPDERTPSKSAFNEEPTTNIKGGTLPADPLQLPKEEEMNEPNEPHRPKQTDNLI